MFCGSHNGMENNWFTTNLNHKNEPYLVERNLDASKIKINSTAHDVMHI